MNVQDALAPIAEPANPLDGDCIEYSNLVTAALSGAGLPAEQATIFGWIDHGGKSILFGHYATLVGDLIIDFTARQFHPELPARWIVPVKEYCEELARRSGADCVTIGWV